MNSNTPQVAPVSSISNKIEAVPLKNIVNDIEKSHNAIVDPQLTDENLKDLSDKEKAELERYKNDTELKKFMASFVVYFSAIWSFCIIIVIICTGASALKLSDGVLITLCTQTLLTVIGLPGIVMYHFFPKK